MFAIHSETLSTAALRARWLELAPVMPEEGRAELDEYGELILAPLPTNRHQRISAWVGHQLQQALGGETGSYAIMTRYGLTAADLGFSGKFQAGGSVRSTPKALPSRSPASL